MPEASSGFQTLTRIPSVYDIYQWLIGLSKARQYIIDKYFYFFQNCNLLDIGCGTGTFVEHLPPGVRYTGIDINEAYIQSAKKNYADKGTFIHLDVNSIDNIGLKENQYDIILLYGVLHHLDDTEVKKTLSSAKKFLKNSGYVITIDGTYIEGQSKIAKYILSKDRGQYVRFDHAYKKLAEECFSNVELFIERNILRIPFDFTIMRMKK
jgi:2-polyprenyl-3-methyl-5-hydroxy-6-metoxy-1,4-benzoquinol methylase